MSVIESILKRLVTVCDERKADDIRAYDVRDNTPVTDFVVVMSVGNTVHLNSLVETIDQEVSHALKEDSSDDFYEFPKVSGSADSGWIVVDLNAIVVHVMVDELREFYELDTVYESRGLVYHY